MLNISSLFVPSYLILTSNQLDPGFSWNDIIGSTDLVIFTDESELPLCGWIHLSCSRSWWALSRFMYSSLVIITNICQQIKRMKRRVSHDVIWRLLLLFAVEAFCAVIVEGARNPPHIMMVMVDDLGWSDVGYNNISAVNTPNIDKLASEGVKLMSYYTQAMCTPSRGAFMTGKYPIHTGNPSLSLSYCIK